MRPYLRRIDTRTRGNRYDVTPLFADGGAFTALVDDLTRAARARRPNRVACIDACGFILGSAIARALEVGVVAVRKGGKLPVDVDRERFVDYTGLEKTLELRRDAVQPNDRVLMVDDWVETGAQLTAAIALVERNGGTISGIAAIHMDAKPATDALRKRYEVHLASELGAHE
jgi:adenine phosphoribosyltransferase